MKIIKKGKVSIETKANEIIIRIKDLSEGEEINKEKKDIIPYFDVIHAYNEELPELKRVVKMTEKRKAQIRKIWNDKDIGITELHHWRNYFRDVRRSDFLMGKLQGVDGRSFKADFEWLTNFNNFVKVYEDKYHD